MSIFKKIADWYVIQLCYWDAKLDEYSPIHSAIERRRSDLVEYFCKKGYDVNETDCNDKIPLHYAAYRGDVESLNILHAYHADLQALTRRRSSILHIATRQNHLPFVKRAIELGLDPNIIGADWQTAFFDACMNENKEMIKYYLSLPQLNINAQNFEGNTPLHVVISNRKMKALRLLFDPQINKLHFSKTDIFLKNRRGDNALSLIESMPNYDEKEEIQKIVQSYRQQRLENTNENERLYISTYIKKPTIIAIYKEDKDITKIEKIYS